MQIYLMPNTETVYQIWVYIMLNSFMFYDSVHSFSAHLN